MKELKNSEFCNVIHLLKQKSIETYQMHWWHENEKLVNYYLNKFNYNGDS
jgi:hypothetical protein